jgi:hypothetical protein
LFSSKLLASFNNPQFMSVILDYCQVTSSSDAKHI